MFTSRANQFPPNAGLCRDCGHARLVLSARGSVFVLCQAPIEHDLPKYPNLPVLACPAFTRDRPTPENSE